MDRIKFEDNNPNKYPGVTRILNILNKPFLIPWANKLGKQGIDVTQYVEDAARKGTLIHEILWSHLTGESIEIPEIYSEQDINNAEKGLDKFKQWKSGKDFQLIFAEKKLVSEKYKYCGIIDLYCIVDRKHTIIDFKSSKSIAKDHFLQLCAYSQLLRENGFQVDQTMVINIPRDEGFKFKVLALDSKNTDSYFNFFKTLLATYHEKERIGWEEPTWMYDY